MHLEILFIGVWIVVNALCGMRIFRSKLYSDLRSEYTNFQLIKLLAGVSPKRENENELNIFRKRFLGYYLFIFLAPMCVFFIYLFIRYT